MLSIKWKQTQCLESLVGSGGEGVSEQITFQARLEECRGANWEENIPGKGGWFKTLREQGVWCWLDRKEAEWREK